MVICGHAYLLNDPVIANKGQIQHFFDNYWLESPENITAVVWSRLSKKPETSSQK